MLSSGDKHIRNGAPTAPRVKADDDPRRIRLTGNRLVSVTNIEPFLRQLAVVARFRISESSKHVLLANTTSASDQLHVSKSKAFPRMKRTSEGKRRERQQGRQERQQRFPRHKNNCHAYGRLKTESFAEYLTEDLAFPPFPSNACNVRLVTFVSLLCFSSVDRTAHG